MTLSRALNDTATQIVGSRGSAVETARGRLMVMGVMFMMAFASLATRVSYLCLWQEGAEPRFEAIRAGADPAALAAGRADILDRNGVLLATTLETMSLYADPKLVPDAKGVAEDLKRIFPEADSADITRKLSGKGRFVWLRRGLSPKEITAVNALGHPGLNFRSESRRFYPQESLTSHIVGYTDVDGTGLAGVERSMNDILKRGGTPVKLAIDVRFQHALRRAVAKSMKDFKAKGAAGVIVDVQTGDIMAAVSAPDFDPQEAGAAPDDAKFNRFALGVYEMGSTFKTFSTAVLLDQVDAKLGQNFDARKPLKRGRFTISDFHAENRILSLPEVFMHSSNIGTALMGEKIGTAKLKNFYTALGFTKPVPTDLSERAQPLVPNPWREINTLTATYGHGIAVTPLHLVRAFSAIVNGGALPALHIVAGEHDETRVRVVSEETSEQMRKLLRLVVTHGTGGKSDAPGIMMAGKTGTSEKTVAGGYSKDKLVSSFIGAFPADKPRYAILISVDEPHGNKESHGYATAGWVAAPGVGAVATAIKNLENLPLPDPEHDAVVEREMARYIQLKPKALKQLAAFER